MNPPQQLVIDETRQWLERAVIGLNLCPFARAPYLKAQVHFQVSEATTPDDLLDDLVLALQTLTQADPDMLETTLLIHPGVLLDFHDFNDFLPMANAAVDALDLAGVLQIASFHPAYQFANTDADDIENFTNRSPYPILHLLRESSVERAVEGMNRTDDIFEANMATLKQLGREGWHQLWATPEDPAQPIAGHPNTGSK